MASLRLRLLLVSSAAALLAGCQQDEIRTYQVPKPEMTRLLGAILPHGDSTWFFKVSGTATEVGSHDTEFDAFLRSLRFTDAGDKPLGWKLPDGWREENNKLAGRYATILIGEGKRALELSVTKLGRDGQAASVLANVNRWRNQLALPAVTQDELGACTKELKTQAGAITLVDLIGAGSGRTGGGAPFAGGRIPPASAPQQKSDLGYRLPEGWQKARNDAMSQAAFAVRDGGKEARITITAMRGMAGGLEAIVNRWRKQVGLREESGDEIRKLAQEMPVDGSPGQFVDLIGPNERILGVMVLRGDTPWFIKMIGPVDLVAKQKASFEAFVRSLRFDGGRGGNDG